MAYGCSMTLVLTCFVSLSKYNSKDGMGRHGPRALSLADWYRGCKSLLASSALNAVSNLTQDKAVVEHRSLELTYSVNYWLNLNRTFLYLMTCICLIYLPYFPHSVSIYLHKVLFFISSATLKSCGFFFFSAVHLLFLKQICSGVCGGDLYRMQDRRVNCMQRQHRGKC